MNVPGSDGKFGFGGSCFPKDIQALINFGQKLGINMNVLEGAWKTNLEVRPEKTGKILKEEQYQVVLIKIISKSIFLNEAFN